MGTQRSTTPRRARSAARSRASGLALIAALQVGSAGMALAVPILDQSSDFESGFTRFDPLPRAQVFTVGSNGMLEAVELFVSRTNPSGNLAVSVEELVAGEPPLPATAVALTSGTIPLAALPSSAAGGGRCRPSSRSIGCRRFPCRPASASRSSSRPTPGLMLAAGVAAIAGRRRRGA